MLRSKNSKMLKAGSLMETLIALTIISICVAVAVTVFVSATQVQSSHFSTLEATQAIDKMMYDDFGKAVFENTTVTVGGRRLKRNVEQVENKQYWQVTYRAQVGNRWLEKVRLVPIKR